MDSLFKSSFLKAVLYFVLFLLFAAFVWFVGPLLSFANLQPFESAWARSAVIGFVGSIIVLNLVNGPVSLPIVAAVCAFIYYITPLISIGATQPFAPSWIRWIIISVILFVYTCVLIYKFWRWITSNSNIKETLAAPFKKSKINIAEAPIKEIDTKVKVALGVLSNMRMGDAKQNLLMRGLRRLVESERHIYELPWYLMIGAEGSGKTSVCLNAGLNLYASKQLEYGSTGNDSQNIASTKNCSWWLTNEAVLIDTAGRYVSKNDSRPLLQYSQISESDLATDTADSKNNSNSSDSISSTTEANQNTEKSAKRQTNTFTSAQVTSAEWLGFLSILRKRRPRTPINGAILTVDAKILLDSNENDRAQMADDLRSRLLELRTELGVQFPVYVMLTKTDSLLGFQEFFSSLTQDSTTQVWGFTLPWQANQSKKNKKQEALETLSQKLNTELGLLAAKVNNGLLDRMHEENDLERRQQLYRLPEEFNGFTQIVSKFIHQVFSDSRFDATIDSNVLRGVYFTSSLQGNSSAVASPYAVMNRLNDGLDKLGRGARIIPKAEVKSKRSYFIHDVFKKIIFADQNLVRPNLMWETRFRLLRLFGYGLIISSFIWLITSLMLSHDNNQSFIDTVNGRLKGTQNLAQEFYQNSNMVVLSSLMDSIDGLTETTEYDVNEPPLTYTYGLYVGREIDQASRKLYDFVAINYLLPFINKRMEQVLRDSITQEDDIVAYETLRAYIMLHEPAQYKTSEVKAWVQNDYQGRYTNSETSKVNTNNTKAAPSNNLNKPIVSQDTPSAIDANNAASIGVPKSEEALTQHSPFAAAFGNKASMLKHIEVLFRDGRVVQSTETINRALVQEVRAFLEKKTRSNRVYDRLMKDIALKAPPDFSIIRAVGADATTLFRTISGESLEQGVPGIFTYEGYHNVFKPEYKAAVLSLLKDDDWLMNDQKSGESKLAEAAKQSKAQLESIEALNNEMLYKYLTEYQEHWTAFLNDIQSVETTNLSHEVNVLRALSEPNSALVRLSRAITEETTITRKVASKDESEKSIFDKVEQSLDSKVSNLQKDLGLNQAKRLEKTLVDDKFAAMRVVVTGQSNATGGAGGSSSAANTNSPAGGFSGGINGVIALVNEYYGALSVIQATAAAGGTPTYNGEILTKFTIEVSKLPSPLKQILNSLGQTSAANVNTVIAGSLQNKAQPVLDRILGLFAQQVTEPCRRTIVGRYPFAPSSQEVAIEDFNSFFASGGVADEFFNKQLLPYVDTSVKPWRYKAPGSVVDFSGSGTAENQQANNQAQGPTLNSEVLKLLAQYGPNPESFAQIGEVRKAFFPKATEKRMSWSNSFKVLEMDPSITELTFNVDGQNYRYAHGPVQPFNVTWPGPRNGTMAEITASPKIKFDTSTKSTTGPWALFRLLEKGKFVTSASTGQSVLEFNFDGRPLQLAVTSSDIINPLNSDVLKRFQCPR